MWPEGRARRPPRRSTCPSTGRAPSAFATRPRCAATTRAAATICSSMGVTRTPPCGPSSSAWRRWRARRRAWRSPLAWRPSPQWRWRSSRRARLLLSSSVIYGGSYRFFRDHLARLGPRVAFRTPAELAGDEWPREVRLLFVESPTNPGLQVLDLPKLAARARAAGVLLAVDGTFATPVLQRPLELGADLVIHSATKALAGHGDLLGGAVLGRRAALAPVEKLRRALGGVLSPDAAFELSRSLKTLELRVLRQSATALKLAKRLARDRRVRSVLYPGLPEPPRSRHRATAAARLWGPLDRRAAGWADGGPALLRSVGARGSGRLVGRSREPGVPAGGEQPRGMFGGAAPGRRDARNGPPVDRALGPRRPLVRPRSGARPWLGPLAPPRP